MAVNPLNNKDIEWVSIGQDMSKNGIKRSFLAKREYDLAKDQYNATDYDDYVALALAIRDRITERWIATQQCYHRNNVKRVYYFSLEFLIGRLLDNNILNLSLTDAVSESMKELGLNLEIMRDCEPDAGLGNGGLGRLAACFLDSMATMGIPAHGYGIRYDYGIFRQKIINGAQVEYPDEWLSKGNPWEFPRTEYAVKVRFYGRTHMFTDSAGRLRVLWVGTEDVQAMPYDIPVVGYKTDTVNNLRLWSAHSSEEFDLKYFNDGDYEKAVYSKVFSENISKVLYPNDNLSQGKELRLKQEYFFTAASIADIIRRYKKENTDFSAFSEKVAIQLNDTHPAIAIVELMRILLDEENLDWDEAWSIVSATFAYTNHTVMPEALEAWHVPMMELILPRHMQIIYEINMRFLREAAMRFPGDNDRLRRMSIIEECSPKRVRMAHLCVIAAYSVNGVSVLHSKLLRKELFKDFYELYPKKFNNKTNGITPRRWLMMANPKLADLITQTIGEGWRTDIGALEKLISIKNNSSFNDKWRQIKKENKQKLSEYIFHNTGITVDPSSLFDVQIKRIHEYKRQLLFGLYIIGQYLKIKNNPGDNFVPRTFIMGGKSAPGYYMAKLIIKFINSAASVINNDPDTRDIIKLIFLENYQVSLAEKIFPASDLSEQISTAGMEASGTGCMKFMMNGALTIGTWDGANIEIAQAVGKDNIFMFGKTIEEIKEITTRGYKPQEYIRKSPLLNEVISLINSNFFSQVNPEAFKPIVGSLTFSDWYFHCADFDDYCLTQDKVSALYAKPNLWVEKAIINVARSAGFSSDRTIGEYAQDIWKIKASANKKKQ